jgi:large subunit ribosomal protein L31e
MVKSVRRGKLVVTRDYTINLYKKLHSLKTKSRVPKAVEEIRKFVYKIMGTKDVRLDTALNQALWANGISEIPNKLRVSVARRHKEKVEENAKVRAGRGLLAAVCCGGGEERCAGQAVSASARPSAARPAAAAAAAYESPAGPAAAISPHPPLTHTLNSLTPPSTLPRTTCTPLSA